jgi:hypothetical protein
MKKSWMLNDVSYSPILGLRGDLVGIYDSEAAAKEAAKMYIQTWRMALIRENIEVEVDFDKLAAWYASDPSTGSRWFITPIETP